jgi:serine/threonine protein kinase/Tol biopolymer transport system component
MPLTSGTKIGIYEINSLLGVGGMGEVYRSLDSKLGRQVALKVLPSGVAADADRLGRFSREAKLLAALNHPNIASIYGLEDSGATHALVMELVEGPTLADRIKLGPIPIDEALPVAKQICEALEYAHERGIVHRDLKPANVKVTPDDTVKVLDFGLAKALETEVAPVDLGSSPTMSRMATQAGMILGTAAYMSPEQARGKPADRRADIWAFGCVFYEMLAGKMAFAGDTVSDTLAAILKEPPDWSLLPPNTPGRIRVLIQRCLQKDPRQRLQAIGDARISIDEVLAGAPEPQAAAKAEMALPLAPAWLRLLPWGIAALLGAGLLFSLVNRGHPSHSSAPGSLQLSLPLPADRQLEVDNGPAFAVSPDGTRIAYIVQNGAANAGQLYVRELSKDAPVALEGIGLAAAPFFSPDSQWIGFFGDGKLRKVSVRGGSPIDLAAVSGFRGGTWGTDDTIVYPDKFTSPLYRVSAAGGTPQQVTHFDKARAETTHRWPQFLPGNKAVLFTASSNNNFFGQATVQVVSLDTGVSRVLVENASFGRYLPGGYLAYSSQGTLFVAPFDPSSFKITGTAIPVLQGIESDISNGGMQFSCSDNGMAVYMSGSGSRQNLSLVLLDRKGEATVLLKSSPDATSPRLSPDGKKVAFQRGVGGAWVHDVVRGTTSAITLKSGSANFPIWTPDGQNITYSYTSGSSMGVGEQIYMRRADGSSDELQLTSPNSPSSYPSSWSPDGKVLAYLRISQKDGSCCDIWTLRLDENGKPQEPRMFLDTSGGKSASLPEPEFSPDGRWIAYSSVDAGLPQIYVVPFPGPGGKWQVSIDGGAEPRWAKNGHELFFVKSDQLYVVPYTTDKNSFQAGTPQVVFQQKFEMRFPYTTFDVSADGQHIVGFQFEGGKKLMVNEPTVFINWLDEVRRQVSTAQSSTPR